MTTDVGGQAAPHVFIRSARGCRVTDIDDNSYIDLCMGFGSNLLGHSPENVERSIIEQVQKGWNFGLRGEDQLDFANLIQQAGESNERVLLCASGTEATALAMRAARAYTGKDAIGVFDGSYHGAHDYGLIVAAPSKNGTKAHVGAGIPNAVDSLVEPLIFGSSEAFERIRELRNSLAAVIVEPIQSSCPLSDGGAWLRELEQVCRDCNVLVILDEIMTGFRLAYGGGQELFELSPDLVTYGKSLAGGTPVGAVAGKADVMQMFTPDSRGVCVFAGSAFAGNPITVAAGQTTLAYLMDNKSTLYDTLNQKTAQLVSKVNTFWSEANMPLRLIAFGSMVRFVCQSEPVRRSTDINSKLRHAEDVFMVHVLDHGVMIHASRRGFISTAHTDKDIDLVANALIGASDETAADGFFRDI